MSMHHGQHQPTGAAPDLSLGGLLIGFPLLISCVFILFSSLWTALFLAGYAVIAFGLGAVAADTNRLAKIGATLLFLSVLAAALVLGFGVFTFHWLSLTLAGWAVTGTCCCWSTRRTSTSGWAWSERSRSWPTRASSSGAC